MMKLRHPQEMFSRRRLETLTKKDGVRPLGREELSKSVFSVRGVVDLFLDVDYDMALRSLLSRYRSLSLPLLIVDNSCRSADAETDSERIVFQ
jgi:hypothetical protein